MKALFAATFFLSALALHAGPKEAAKKKAMPKKVAPVVQKEPEELKSGPQPDGRVIITSRDLNRSGSNSVSGALRHYPYLFIRSH